MSELTLEAQMPLGALPPVLPTAQRAQYAAQVHEALSNRRQGPVLIYHGTLLDANGAVENAWLYCADEVIVERGVLSGAEDLEQLQQRYPEASFVDAQGGYLLPGYVDIHAHGAWQAAYDDDEEQIKLARAGHLYHGTTRQVLSLITNPMPTLCANLERVAAMMPDRPDILGTHLEGPFLSVLHKGAHDPNCLVDPTDERVEALLKAANGTLRQITLAPELEHGMQAVQTFTQAGVRVAVGHTDADYETATQAYERGATLMTHMFNAMNGIHHRTPGPIPAAAGNQQVIMECINDGFHIANPVVQLGWSFDPDRIAWITDAMAATDCEDGDYYLGSLQVQVRNAQARLVSNGAIAGSTLVMERAVSRAVLELGIDPVAAVKAATLTPAKAFGLHEPNEITHHPIGLLSAGYAADVLIADCQTWQIQAVWCQGQRVR